MRATVKSIVTRSLNVRSTVTGLVVAALRYDFTLNKGDAVYGEVKPDDRIYFSKIYRATGTVQTLSDLCSAVTREGTTYWMDLADVPEPGTEPPPEPEPPPAPEEYVIHVKDGVARRFILEGEPAIEPVPFLPYWRYKTDEELWGKVRECAPCPAVMVFNDTRVDLSMQWQYFIRAINYNMTVDKVSAIFGYKKAFTNGTGLGDPGDPRVDFIKGENLFSSLPQFDKTRTCARSTLTGAPAYSITQMFRETVSAIASRSVSAFRSAFAVADNVLRVTVLDGNRLPALKAGKAYPGSVSQINPDDYLYTPRTHRHLFFAANIVNLQGEIVPFPNGALYDWFGPQPVTWLPHVCKYPVSVPLANLVQLPAGARPPSPYR